MVSLIDLIDIKKTVTIRGQQVEVDGLNAEKLGQLILAYPDLRLPFAGRAFELTPEAIIKLGPKIVASVIAAGTCAPGDPNAEAAAAKLTLGEQAAVIQAILDITFPDGVGPFAGVMRSLGLMDESGEVAGSGWVPGTNSQKPSSPSPATTEAAPPSSN